MNGKVAVWLLGILACCALVPEVYADGMVPQAIPPLWVALVVAGAAGCGAGGETMRQLALTQLGEPDGPEEL